MRIALLGLLAACGSVGGKPDATVHHDASSPTAGAATFTPNFNGAADELAHYNGALSATEVMAHYSAPDGICL